MNHHLRLALTIAGLGMITGLSGCSSTSSNPIVTRDIDFEEKDQSLPTLGFSKKVSERISVEIEQSRLKEETELSLATNERYRLEEQTIDGPVDLVTDYEIRATKVGAAFHVLDLEDFGIKAEAGLSQVDFTIWLDDTTQEYKLDDDNTGIYTRLNLILPLMDNLYLSGIVGYTNLYQAKSGELIEMAARLTLELGENIEVFGGWFGWDYKNNEFRTDFDLELEGLQYGVKFKF